RSAGGERLAGELLVLVLEPPDPRRLAVRPAAGADAVELDQVALDVRLQHGALDAAPGQPAERGLDLAGRRGAHDVALLRVVDIAALHPYRQGARLRRLAGADDSARE